MDAPVTCDACGEERRRSARIFRNVCITLRFADFSLREGAERFLRDSARFCQLLLRIWRWPDQRVASLGGGVYESAASETRLTRRAGLRASIEGGAPATEDHRHHSDREPGSYKRAGRVISGAESVVLSGRGRVFGNGNRAACAEWRNHQRDRIGAVVSPAIELDRPAIDEDLQVLARAHPRHAGSLQRLQQSSAPYY